jgi:hypothetical protein
MRPAAGSEVRSVTLRQLRTPAGSLQASYLALVSFRMQVTAFHEGAVLGGAPLDLLAYDSFPIRTTLGLPAGGLLQPISETWYRAASARIH